MIDLSIDVTMRQGAFTLRIRDAASVEVLGLFGPSGSGKTSLLEAIAGIRTPEPIAKLHEEMPKVYDQLVGIRARG